MLKTLVEATINRSITDVFEFVADLETMVKYNSSIKASTWEGTERKSCKILVNLSIININGIYRIEEFIPGKKIVASCTTDSLEFTDTYEFRDLDGKTHLSIEDKMTLKGLLSLSEGIVKPILQKEMLGNLKTLQNLLEKP